MSNIENNIIYHNHLEPWASADNFAICEGASSKNGPHKEKRSPT